LNALTQWGFRALCLFLSVLPSVAQFSETVNTLSGGGSRPNNTVFSIRMSIRTPSPVGSSGICEGFYLRQWPAHRFAELMDQLAFRWPDSLFGILGVADQREAAEQLREQISPPVQPRVHVLAGQTSLPLLSALLRRSVLLVTNDGGIMHLAAAVHAPIVALFGPESPVRYAPLSRSTASRVLSADVVCGPCLTYMNRKRAPCHGNNECMNRLKMEQVLAACLELQG
jgi:ADP-heptose:LPS heptosyltransferase